MTYRELATASRRIAAAILSARGPVEEPVALLLELGPPAIAAILGALDAGKIYVPLDPHLPAARLAELLSHSGAGMLLTTSGYPVPAPASGLPPVRLDLDRLADGAPDPGPAPVLDPGRGAHLLYTSGTTGRPKGVLQSHRNLLFEVDRVIRAFPVGPEDRLALLHPVNAAASLRRIFPALLAGGSLHLRDLKAEGLAGLPDWLAAEGITIANGRRLLRDCQARLTGPGQFPALRLVTFGGEPVHPRDVELFQRYLAPHCRMLVNLCTTETGSDCHFFFEATTPVPRGVVPVGYPTEGTEILILGPDGEPVPPGTPGEIATRSRSLALGYWRDPASTAERFVPVPGDAGLRTYLSGDLGRCDPDGCVYFLGRKDRQLKVRGHRIEALEVEGALLSLGPFAEAVVAALATPRLERSRGPTPGAARPRRVPGSGERRLVAFVATVPGAEPDLAAVRATLATRLPAAAVPGLYVRLDRLPRTDAGKVDQAALEACFLRTRPWSDRQDLAVPLVPARDPLEAALVALWREHLDMDEIGVHDSFLELGGDSLMALSIHARIRRDLGVDLPVRALYESPTVAALAQAVAACRAGA